MKPAPAPALPMVLGGIILSTRCYSSLNLNRLISRINPPTTPTAGALRRAPRGSFDMTSSSSSYVTDDNGRRWRQCAGAAVLNSKNEMLVGERIGRAGSWQAPQGGINADESIVDAASRELYEEVGLVMGRHVVLEGAGCGDGTIVKCRYETEGTGGWLEREGYAGQELHWVVFRSASSILDVDPSVVCDLSGMNGEESEFTNVKWNNIDNVVNDVWENKAAPYRMLLERAIPAAIASWETRCANLDLGGMWSRDNARSVGIVEALIARGQTREDACRKSSESYVQMWRRHESNRGEWIVTTYYEDYVVGGTNEPRRELRYAMGEFVERYEGTSTIFGSDGGGGGGGIVTRRCFYLAEPDADGGIAHVTVSETPLGGEESLRYIKDGELVLRRTYWPSSCRTHGVVSTEVFVKL
jgi:putative (di)nucleoside polyphosphate hydrolase